MKSIGLWFVRAVMIASLVGYVSSSSRALGAEYPRVSNLTPFSMECNYMSQPGYLRYLTFVQDGTWISHHEAVAIVKQEEKSASSY